MASRGGVRGGRGGGGGGEGGDESDSSGIEQGDEPPHVHRAPSQCSEGSNASSGSGDTEGPEEGFSSDHAQVILQSICVRHCLLRGPPLWSGGQSFWLQIQRSWVRFLALPDFLSGSGSGTGYTQPREAN